MNRKSGFSALWGLLSSIIINFLLTPLLILKQVGELFIATIFYIFSLIVSTYKLLLNLIRQLFSLFKKIILYPFRNFALFLTQRFRLRKEKKENKFRKKIKLFFLELKFFVLGFISLLVILLYFQFNSFVKNLPNPGQIKSLGFPATTKIYDRNGILLYEIYGSYNRTPISLSNIPTHVKQATILAEDKEFYIHNGISLRGMTRALLHNLTSDSLEGGSTITQQLIRSTYLTPERTMIRKLKEIILSVWIEKLYSKDQILEMYLNQVPYGGTAWGIEAAAENYFNKKSTDLNLAEAAVLAGLPASPSKYSPFNNPINYRNRQLMILKRMISSGYINQKEFDEAKDSNLSFNEPRAPIAAPHFVMYVKELLNKYYGPRLTETGGLRVTTTLDLKLQENTQKILSEQINNLKGLLVTNGAALITNPQNGEILTMVGSADYFDKSNDGNVNVTQSLRQPGSSIKVVNYAAALQNGFTASSIINDSPITYSGAGQAGYRPVNYDGRFHGPVTLRTALASSYNIPAVKVLNTIGVDKMIDTGKDMGIDTWENRDRFGLSLTLGGGEVTMTDMAEVYGTLANNGTRNNLIPLIKITDYNGRNLPLPILRKPYKAIPEAVAYILTSILSDNEARAPAFGRNSALNIDGKTIAVKTGTSDNKRDNWTIGYTKDFVTTVWVGNNDNKPMHPQLTSGVTGAAPIWRATMEMLLSDKKNN